MKKLTALIFFLITNLSVAYSDDLKLILNENTSGPGAPLNRWFAGGEIGATLGDYTQINISPFIGYRISPQVSTGIQFIYNHSWQKVNENQANQTTLQSNTYGGNYFLQYNPVKEFYLKGEFEYDSYQNYTTTQNTKVTQGVPFLFLGMGYSKAITKSATFNAGIKFDVLNNENSPYEDYTPFFYVGAGVGI